MFRCDGMKQLICTAFLLFSIVLMALGTVLCHMSLNTLLPPVVDLRANVRSGLDDVLQFASLEAKSLAVRTNAQAALALCNVTNATTDCATASTTNLQAVDSSSQLLQITDAFDGSLATIQTVVHDVYFGLATFQTSGTELDRIQANLTSLRNLSQPIPCGGTNQFYCTIHSSAATILTQADQVKAGVDTLVNAKFFVDYDGHVDKARYLHALPYISWLGILFYLCFFVGKGATSPCRGGSRKACCACAFHGIFWFLFFLISAAIVAAGIAIHVFSDEFEIKGVFAANPTLKQIVNHIEVNFPGFYDIVLRWLLEGLTKMYNAFVLFLVADLMLLVHTLSACACGLYRAGAKELEEEEPEP